MNGIASTPFFQGIERAPLHEQPALKSSSTHSQLQEKSSPTSSITRISRHLKAKIHRRSLPDFSTDQRLLDKPVLAPTLAPDASIATKEDRLDGEPPPAKPSLPPVKDFFHHPARTLKTIAHVEAGGDVVEKIAAKDVSHEAGVQLVRANEELADANSEHEEALALEKLSLLKIARQESYVRWTLDRHISKIGRVQPRPWIRKTKQDFVQPRENGKKETNWRSYGQYQFQSYVQEYGRHYIGVSDDLPEPTESALISSFERILLTSKPVQDLFMSLRRISHWENPGKSGACMVIYFVFWFYNYITRSFLLLALYVVIKRRYFPPTIPELREDLKAAEDKETTVRDISQLIDQHGSHGWVDPLIEKAGPTALLHMEDLANFMEVLRNFYEWRDPTRTAITLGWLIVLWIMITITPVSILVKESFFAIGVHFFLLAPLAARYPRYRLLLNPLTWLFWRIPTHSDWAIARLKAEAAQHLEVIREQKNLTPTPTADHVDAGRLHSAEKAHSDASLVRIGKYHCISDNRPGKLLVDTVEVSFEVHLAGSERWRLRYSDMESIEKATGSNMIAGHDLLFTKNDGTVHRASGLKARDELFSQIIGYSNVPWHRIA